MIKCMIVAGKQASPLTEFITANAGGTIVIPEDYIFTSFSEQVEDIKRCFIRADYLILMLDEMRDLKEEFMILYNLLLNNTAYFKIDVIKVFGAATDDNAICSKYLVDLMSEVNEKKGLSIVVDQFLSDDITFSSVYNEITDIVEIDNATLPINRVYRAYKGDATQVGYEPKDFPYPRIERVVTNHAKEYVKIQKSAIKAETGRPINDSVQEPLDNVNLEIRNVSVAESCYKKNIIVVSGAPKSGTSSFAFALVRSFYECNKLSTNLFDISENCGSTWSIIHHCSDYKIVNNKDLLTGASYTSKGLYVFSSSEYSDLIKIEYLKFLLSVSNKIPADYIVIDCDFKDFYKVVNLCSHRIKKIILCAQHSEKEVLFLKKPINYLHDEGYTTLLYLNDSFKYENDSKIVDAEYVGKVYPWIKMTTACDLMQLYDFKGIIEGDV